MGCLCVGQEEAARTAAHSMLTTTSHFGGRLYKQGFQRGEETLPAFKLGLAVITWHGQCQSSYLRRTMEILERVREEEEHDRLVSGMCHGDG